MRTVPCYRHSWKVTFHVCKRVVYRSVARVFSSQTSHLCIFVLRTVELEKGDPLKVNTLVNVIAVSSITY